MAQTQVEQRAIQDYRFKSNLVLGMCLVYFVNFFIQSSNFNVILSLICVAVFLLSLRNADTAPRIFSGIMFGLGVIFTISKGAGIEGFTSGITMNLPLLILVMLVPLISIPLKISGYFETVRFYLEKMMTDTKKLFGSISFFLFCLGPVLNLGSIRILHETIKDIKLPSLFLAKSYLVGFSTVILWSPYFASVALVLYYLDVPVSEYIPLGLTMAVIQLMVGNLLYRLYLKKRDHVEIEPPTNRAYMKNEEESNRQRQRLIALIGIILLLMSSIFILEYLTKWPMMFLVSLVSVLYPVLWAVVKKEWKNAEKLFSNFKKRSLPGMNNEVVLFISAGLFGKSLQGTVVADTIRQFLNGIASTSFLLLSVTITATIVILCFIGVHQVVVVTALVTQIDPVALGTTPEVIALLIMVSWSIGAVISPVNPLNLLVSHSVERSGILIGLRWNGTYLLSMFLVGTLFVWLIH